MSVRATPTLRGEWEDGRRSSIEKTPSMKSAAFNRLPDEIIEKILLLTNPNSFASLIVLNRKWRMVSQQSHLYSHHLSRCPSYTAAHPNTPVADDDDSLPQLRRLFAREIKRNLFEAYLRPQETIVNLVSTSISSASAPGGEAFQFSLSPRGHYVLAYSSSRIHVLDVTGAEIEVKRELRILRRPASTTITDDGSMLAVLSTDLQVDVYDLTGEHPRHSRIVSLDHAPRTIALSPNGSVLAAAYDSGVEVSSLDPNCISTDRRAVKCYAVDSLSFSRDSTQLLGSTIQSKSPSTVVLTAPYHDPGGSLPEESISALWTTSILFPNGSRDCSHAVLLQNSLDEEASWTFTYDRVFETFRAVRIDDLRNGTTYFTGPIAQSGSGLKLLPSTLPAASEAGDLVSAGFQGYIWLYGVPEDLEALPISNEPSSNLESESSSPSSQPGRRSSMPTPHSSPRIRDSTLRIPQWQILCDRSRNTFVEGRNISSLCSVSAMKWVGDSSTSSHKERLVAVAPGVASLDSEDDGMNPTDGGRISILDFDYSTNDGRRRVITVEVGDKEPEVLEEEQRDIATEVALVRRRTVAQKRGGRGGMSRSATTVTRPIAPSRDTEPAIPPMPSMNGITDSFGLPPSGTRRPSRALSTTTEQSETTSVDDEDAFESPYSQSGPRSGTTLRRAATAAAVNRRLHPRSVAQEHIEYRRADGREEHPHESDADNWVPPPPPYTKDPVPPLPEHIQRSILAEAAAVSLQRSASHRSPTFNFPALDGNSLQRSRTLASVSPAESRRYPFNRARSDSTTRTVGGFSNEEEPPRPATSPSHDENDDLYDVSPEGSPRLSPRTVPAMPNQSAIYQIPRRPVGARSANSNDVPITTPPLPMQATIQQPVSPIPHPMPETLDIRLQHWESATEDETEQESPSIVPPARTPLHPVLTRNRMSQEVPPRPNEDHHLAEVPPISPIIIDRRQEIESQTTPLSRRAETVPTNRAAVQPVTEEPLQLWRRAETAPVSPPKDQNTAPGVSMPSADQLARLNSRKGHPPSQVLTDPSRRTSGSFSQPQQNRSQQNSEHPSWGSRKSMQQTPPRMTAEPNFRSTPPRGAVGAHNSPASGDYVPHLQPQPNGYSSPRRTNLSPSPGTQRQLSSSPGPRPPLRRLDTIHSITSTGGLSPWVAPKMTLGRQGSGAESGAKKNIKDAKRRGWRASMRKRGVGGDEDGVASSAWTDVSPLEKGKKERKEGKCVVM